MRRLLVAGIGNDFFRDDGFGPAVVRRVLARGAPPNVALRDVGIRALHLAYELADGWDELLVVDAVSRGGPPGTLHLIEPTESDCARRKSGVDAHGMDLASILAAARALGATLPRVLVLGCDVGCVDEGIGLTPNVERAVRPAVTIVESIAQRLVSATTLWRGEIKEEASP